MRNFLKAIDIDSSSARFIIGALVAACLLLFSFRAPEPIVDSFLEKDIRLAAEVWQSRILQQLEEGADVFEAGKLGKPDRNFLNNIPKTSDLHRVTLIDRKGYIFFSTLGELTGKVHDDGVFHSEILDGETFYQVKMLPPEKVEGLELHISSSDHYDIREVAVIDLPVIQNGRFVGTVEFQRDITVLRETSLMRMRVLIGAVGVIGVVVLMAVLIVVMRVNRQKLQLAREKSALDREAMSDQMRMARDVRLLGELNGWLQSSRSLEELFDMVARFMTHLFPESEGSIYVYSNSRDVLDGCVSWNGGEHKEHIRPEECWGLRRGRTYAYGDSEIDFTCAHSQSDDKRAYVCFPILAHGETVGLLHLRARHEASAEDFRASRSLAQTSAEQISLAIANVRMRDQLQDQSIRDPLTGLYNRRHLTDRLRKAIGDLERTNEPLSIVSIDVDHFKKFNDNHGHDAGDMVLRAVGSALIQACDGEEIACRTGGEEFMLLLPQTDTRSAVERAEALRKGVEKIVVRYGEKNLPRITISVGVAGAPDHGMLPQEIIRVADDALYSAKAAGRNQVILARCEGSEGEIDVPDLVSTVAEEPAAHSHSILIIEDNEIDKLIYMNSLFETGLQIDFVENSRAAIETFENQRPKLVLVNMVMSGADGHEAVRTIRELDAASSEPVTIIGIATHDMEDAEEIAVGVGMDRCICKPLSQGRILDLALGLVVTTESTAGGSTRRATG